MNRAWGTNYSGVLDILPFYLAFSLCGWVLVGIPFVLLVRSEVIVRLHWLIVVVIGLLLGALAQFLIFLWLGITGHLNLPVHWGGVLAYEELAMLISVVAVVVYWLLVRRTLRHQ